MCFKSIFPSAKCYVTLIFTWVFYVLKYVSCATFFFLVTQLTVSAVWNTSALQVEILLLHIHQSWGRGECVSISLVLNPSATFCVWKPKLTNWWESEKREKTSCFSKRQKKPREGTLGKKYLFIVISCQWEHEERKGFLYFPVNLSACHVLENLKEKQH